MNKLDFYWIDAFTTEQFGGNPAVVVLSQEPLPESLMQNYATEFNQSETAFVWPLDKEEAGNKYSLRWFTPIAEIGLCGHATLASTFAASDLYGLTDIIFSTASGEIKASNHSGELEIIMPRLAVTPVDKATNAYEILTSAIDQEVISIHKSETNFLVELASEENVKEACPNISALMVLECVGVIITAKSDAKKHDFVSRYFAPKMGIDEDPVTGSAHSSLAPFWAPKLNKTHMVGAQLSQRGGQITVKLNSDSVAMQGKCKALFKGTNNK